MKFRFVKTRIPEVVLVEAPDFRDHRGTVTELYFQPEFKAGGIRPEFIYGVHSRSSRNVLRGLHFQRPPKAQAKLVGVIRGRIFDVAVDVRRGSPTFGRWTGTELSKGRMLYVPPGFAHGFCVLGNEADVLFMMSREHAAAHEGGVSWDDPDISIRWPVREPVLSAKDSALPRLRDLRPAELPPYRR